MDYFEEMGWAPIENTQEHQLLLFARYLQQRGDFDEEIGNQIKAPPASKDIVSNLKRIKVSETNEKCAICLKPSEQNSEEEIFVVLPCSHSFHDSCILPWLAQTNSCPLCRYELKTDDVDYEEMKKRQKRAKDREEDIESLHNSMFS